jgi:A/G-specific adenine glycosylase
MPGVAEDLRALPGVGSYTAAAIASIAYNETIAAVDGNVERVLCRMAGWAANGSHERKVEELASRMVDAERPGDFNQAMMELGATVCLPRNPQCLVCPFAEACKTRGEHKTSKRARAVVREVGYGLCLNAWGKGDLRDPDKGAVLLEQRPATVSVMPGLWELPALREVPNGDARMTVRHAIMNVNYIVRILDVGEEQLAELTQPGGQRRWVPLSEAGRMALTGLARKVLKRVNGRPLANSLQPRLAHEIEGYPNTLEPPRQFRIPSDESVQCKETYSALPQHAGGDLCPSSVIAVSERATDRGSADHGPASSGASGSDVDR